MIDTSKEAVDISICNPIIRIVHCGVSPSLDDCGMMIDVARALLAERDALQAQLNDPAHAAKVLLDNCPNPIFDELKYQMIGEFSQTERYINEDGDEDSMIVTIDWTTTKDIITSALRAIALDTTTATCDNTREGE